MRIQNQIYIHATPDTVWDVTVDVENWPTWTPTVRSVERLEEGPLEVGSTARIRQPGLPPAVWRVTELEPGRRFTWETQVINLEMRATHEISRVRGRTQNTLRIEIQGLVSILLWPLLYFPTRQALIDENEGLKAHCEKREEGPPGASNQIEKRLHEILEKHSGVPAKEMHPEMTIIEDLHMDSLEIVETVIDIEEAFDIEIPDDSSEPVIKQVFTRRGFTIGDYVELIQLCLQMKGSSDHDWKTEREDLPRSSRALFTQLDGVFHDDLEPNRPLLESLGRNDGGFPLYRRRRDGMQCVLVPAATVELGDDSELSAPDERPVHEARLEAFLMDVEPVSTTAYARFLNSIELDDEETLRRWFVLAPGDRRGEHLPLERPGKRWKPVEGTEQWPMMLVSWHGASAYSLWANGEDWRGEARGESLLPLEAQWEYAARGATRRRYPWGNEEPTARHARLARHRWGQTYGIGDLPLADVNEKLGRSPFGLRHMAGNVWHWCRDDYDPDFYASEAARGPDPLCTSDTGVKCERGGSWIGPATLARTSSRRGRPPLARGRCLGFRCVGKAPESS